jgi:PAS domain S-box-containing protein
MVVILDQEYLDNAVATTRSLARARASDLALRGDDGGVFSIRSAVGPMPEGWADAFCERVFIHKAQLTERADASSPAVAQGVYIKRDTFDGVVFMLFEPGTEFSEDMLMLLGHRFEFLIEIGMRANKYEAMQQLVPELSEKLQRVLSAVQMGIWEWDIDNNYVQWDDAMYRLYKRDPKDQENHFARWMDALHPDDRPTIQMMMKVAIENPLTDALNLRFRIYDDTDAMRYIVSKGKIFRDASGRAVHMSGVNIDVTEEETTSEKLKRVLHAVNVGIWEWDVVNDVLHADEFMYSLYGIRERSVLDSFASWIVVVHPDDREKMVRLVQTSEQDGSNFLETRFRITTDAGEVRHIMSKGEIVRAEDGRVVRMRGVNVDITAEERLLEKLRCVLDAGSIGIWEWDVLANEIEWDESMYRLYGKHEGTSTGVYADWLNSLHPDDRTLMHERTQMLLEDPKADSLEIRFRVVMQGMPVRHVLGKADIQRDASGRALRMLGVNIDVTREEELLAEIQQNRDELKQFFDNMHEGVIIDDSHAIVIECNPAAAKILRCQTTSLVGKSAAEIGRRAIQDIGKPTSVDDLSIYEALRTGKPVIGRVSGMYLDSGELIWIRINVVPLFRPDDETPYRLLITFEDITEMRKYMTSLNDEKARYENLVYGLNEAACVSMTDPDGRITMINDKFVNLMGYPREELIGHTHRAMRSGIHTTEFCRHLWDTVTDGRVWHGEFCNRTKSGKLVWLDTTIIPMLNSEGHVEAYMSVRFDITAKREFEQQLYESRESEIRANNAKSEFLASMSHEIRTPMNGIIGMAQLLMDTNLTEEQRDCAQTIVSSGDLLLTIINDILDLSKIESGTLQLDVARVDGIDTWEHLIAAAHALATQPHDFKTLVIDTLDRAEWLCWQHLCARARVANIEAVGKYGRGYTAAYEEFRVLARALDTLRTKRGMGVIVVAHSKIENAPNAAGDEHQRWTLKVHKQVAGLFYEGFDAGTTRLDGTTLFNGAITADTTDSSGTPGAATINKPSGKVAIAIGQSSVTVTNSLVTSASTVLAVLQFADATATTILNVVPTSGAFTINVNANATAATKVAFLVVN